MLAISVMHHKCRINATATTYSPPPFPPPLRGRVREGGKGGGRDVALYLQFFF